MFNSLMEADILLKTRRAFRSNSATPLKRLGFKYGDIVDELCSFLQKRSPYEPTSHSPSLWYKSCGGINYQPPRQEKG